MKGGQGRSEGEGGSETSTSIKEGKSVTVHEWVGDHESIVPYLTHKLSNIFAEMLRMDGHKRATFIIFVEVLDIL